MEVIVFYNYETRMAAIDSVLQLPDQPSKTQALIQFIDQEITVLNQLRLAPRSDALDTARRALHRLQNPQPEAIPTCARRLF